jgi:hypothetical protein
VTSIRSGLRKRKRAESPQSTEPQVTEDWVDEDKLELWEIKQYGDRYVCSLAVRVWIPMHEPGMQGYCLITHGVCVASVNEAEEWEGRRTFGSTALSHVGMGMT